MRLRSWFTAGLFLMGTLHHSFGTPSSDPVSIAGVVPGMSRASPFIRGLNLSATGSEGEVWGKTFLASSVTPNLYVKVSGDDDQTITSVRGLPLIIGAEEVPEGVGRLRVTQLLGSPDETSKDLVDCSGLFKDEVEFQRFLSDMKLTAASPDKVWFGTDLFYRDLHLRLHFDLRDGQEFLSWARLSAE